MRTVWSLAFGVVALLMLGVVVASGCAPTSGASGEGVPAAWLRFDLEKSNPERLLRHYFGGYTSPEGADPFQAGLLIEQGDRFYLDLDSLEAFQPGTRALLEEAGEDDRLEWEELAPFLQATYYGARQLPPTLADLQAEASYRSAPEAWFNVDIDGVMTTARRRVYVPYEALRSALQQYWHHEEKLIYPIGTTIVGEHWAADDLVETTLMRKRADGFWDFAVYDAAGRLAGQTSTPPRALDAPTQCVGCHFGNKLFDPAKSFPAEALPSPHGPSRLHVEDDLRDAEVTRFFQEHGKRSDTVLGLYNTLFVARLRADRAAGLLDEADALLLQKLGL